MSADLIIYAVVAAGLVFWLKSVLGTRHGDERERHNPYAQGSDLSQTTDGKTLEQDQQSAEDIILDLSQKSDSNTSIDNKSAENGLIEIAKVDRSFDVKAFIQGAQDAFVIIVESFAEGDRETLKNLLADPVYNAFEGAIKQREDDEETLETEIHAIKRAEIIEAELQGKMAFVTLRFLASETSVTRDKDGEITSGDPDKTTDMHDVWVFGRNIKSRDPKWLVYETRGDIEDDNEILPNTDEKTDD